MGSANQLIGRKEISNMYRGKCLICKEFKEDNFLHWISDCTTLTNLRNKYQKFNTRTIGY